jgi:hypothetical protein
MMLTAASVATRMVWLTAAMGTVVLQVTLVIARAPALALTVMVPTAGLLTAPMAKPIANAPLARDGEDVGNVVEAKGMGSTPRRSWSHRGVGCRRSR